MVLGARWGLCAWMGWDDGFSLSLTGAVGGCGLCTPRVEADPDQLRSGRPSTHAAAPCPFSPPASG